MFSDGHAPARAGSRPDHREPPFVFCGPGAEAGRFRKHSPGILGGGFRRSSRNGRRGERLFWEADFELPVRRAGARCGSDAAHAASGYAIIAAKDTKNPGTQPGLFRIVSAARRAFLVPEERAGSVSGAEPRSLRRAGVLAEKHGDGICSAHEQAGGVDAHRATELRAAPGAVVLARIERAEFCVLVRAEE